MSLPESRATAPLAMSLFRAARVPRARLLAVGLILGGIALGVWLRGRLVERAKDEALRTLFQLDALPLRGSSSLGADSEAGLSEAEPLADGSPTLASGHPNSKRPKVPDSISVPKERVLEWVRAKKVPRGRAAPGSPWLPPGVVVSGIARFGLGLVESDRLIRVDGAEVRDPSQVISAVVAAFGRGASAITGEFVRATTSGPRTIKLTVHFPTAAEVQAVIEE